MGDAQLDWLLPKRKLVYASFPAAFAQRLAMSTGAR